MDRQIILLNDTQFNTLVNNGSVVIGGVTIPYDTSHIYAKAETIVNLDEMTF
jgi:hypothetical protein